MILIIYLLVVVIFFAFEANVLNLISLLIGRCFHLKLMACHFFCFKWVRENNKLQFKLTQFNPIPQIMQGRIDLTPKEDKTIIALKLFAHACFSVLVIILTRPITDGILRFLLILTTLIFFGIYSFTLLNIFLNGGGTLGRLIKTEAIALNNGVGPITEILQPLSEISYKYTPYEAAHYQLIRAMQLWYADKIDKMDEPITWLDNYVDKQFNKTGEVLLQATAYYYLLLTYYITLCPNTNKAIILYERIKNILLQDQDSNGKRIHAYYQYYIENNASAALDTIKQAQDALSTFGEPGREREMERRLIAQLLDMLS